jgi:hypothetical protein
MQCEYTVRVLLGQVRPGQLFQQSFLAGKVGIEAGEVKRADLQYPIKPLPYAAERLSSVLAQEKAMHASQLLGALAGLQELEGALPPLQVGLLEVGERQ